MFRKDPDNFSRYEEEEDSSRMSANRLTYVEQQLLSLIGELNLGETKTEADIKNQVRRYGLASRMRAIIRDCEDEVPVYNSPLLRGDRMGRNGSETSVSRSSSTRSKKAPEIPPVPPLPPLHSPLFPLFPGKPSMKRSATMSTSVSDSGHSGYGPGHNGSGYADGYGQQWQGRRILKANITPLSIDKVIMRPLALGSPFSASTPVSPAPSGSSIGHYQLAKSNSTGTARSKVSSKGKGKMRWKSDKNKPLPPLPAEATPTPTTPCFGFEDKPLPQLIPSIVLRTLASRTTIVSDRARKVLTVVAEVIDDFDRPPEVDRELRDFIEKQSLGRVLFGDEKERVDRVETNTSLKAANEMREKQNLLSRSASKSSAGSSSPTKASARTIGHRRRRSSPKENRAVVIIQSPGNSDDEEKNVALYSPRNASKDGFQGRTCTGQPKTRN